MTNLKQQKKIKFGHQQLYNFVIYYNSKQPKGEERNYIQIKSLLANNCNKNDALSAEVKQLAEEFLENERKKTEAKIAPYKDTFDLIIKYRNGEISVTQLCRSKFTEFAVAYMERHGGKMYPQYILTKLRTVRTINDEFIKVLAFLHEWRKMNE